MESKSWERLRMQGGRRSLKGIHDLFQCLFENLWEMWAKASVSEMWQQKSCQVRDLISTAKFFVSFPLHRVLVFRHFDLLNFPCKSIVRVEVGKFVVLKWMTMMKHKNKTFDAF